MIRKYFLRSSSLFSAVALVFPITNVFAENLYDNSIDKLVDANGKYIQQALL